MNLIKNLISEFFVVLKEVKNNKLDYFLMFYQFVFISGLVRQLTNDAALVCNIIIMLASCLKTGKLTRKENDLFIHIMIIFLLMNLVPTILFGIAPKLFLGYCGRIFLAFLIVVYFKTNFFDIFEKLIFLLAFISLPLFCIQVVCPTVFNIFEYFSRLVLISERLTTGRFELKGHRYLLIFLVNSWGHFRNSGFMWEPAAFGAMLAWASMINLFAFKFSLNQRFIVMLIAAASTFSIGTFIYFSLIIGIFLTQNIKSQKVYLVLCIILIVLPGILRSDILQENIDMIERKIDVVQIQADRISIGKANSRVSRVGGVLGNFEQIIKNPFGYGANYEFEEFFYDSSNGLIALLRNWGFSVS